MEPNRSILKLETTTETQAEAQQTSTHYICIRCGKQFTKPIFAVNNSPGIAEAYYACPSCLSKVEIRKEEKTAQVPEEAAPEESKTENPAKSVSEPPATPSVCTHYAGYLKKRPKNTPVPEECFTCTLMLDCMSR